MGGTVRARVRLEFVLEQREDERVVLDFAQVRYACCVAMAALQDGHMPKAERVRLAQVTVESEGKA